MSEKKTELKNFEDIAKFLQNPKAWEKCGFVAFNK